MDKYEYDRVELDVNEGDLSELNRLASSGWHVVTVITEVRLTPHEQVRTHYALLERPLSTRLVKLKP